MNDSMHRRSKKALINFFLENFFDFRRHKKLKRQKPNKILKNLVHPRNTERSLKNKYTGIHEQEL